MTDLNNKKYPSYEYLHECFEYKAETGELFWKVRPDYHFANNQGWKMWNTRYSGKKAGSKLNTGYYVVSVNREQLLLHRVIFILKLGYNPENDIDHVNGNIRNNKIDNLRESSRSCTVLNSRLRENNKTGVSGVSWHKNNKKYIVQLCGLYIASHKNFNEAVKARWQAEVENELPDCNTTSSAYVYLKENNLI